MHEYGEIGKHLLIIVQCAMINLFDGNCNLDQTTEFCFQYLRILRQEANIKILEDTKKYL